MPESLPRPPMGVTLQQSAGDNVPQTTQDELEAVRRSEALLRAILDSTPYAVLRAGLDGRLVFANSHAARLFGYSSGQEMVGVAAESLYANLPERVEVLAQLGDARQVLEMPVRGQRADGTTFDALLTAQSVRDESGQLSGTEAFVRDQSQLKRARALGSIRQRLLEFAATHSLPEVLQQALDDIEEATDSRVSFLHFVEDDQRTLSLQAWSTRTLRDYCRVTEGPRHYDIDRAGVWGDALRERRPVVHNDYEALAVKQGLPDGHAPLLRELVMPVFREGRVVALLGVGNRPTPYTQEDVEAVDSLAGVAWEAIQRKRVEADLLESERKYRAIIATAMDGFCVLDPAGRILEVNDRMVRMTGYSRAELLTKQVADLEANEGTDQIRDHTAEIASRGEHRFSTRHRRKDGAVLDVEVSVQHRPETGGYVAFLRDITDARDAERRLAEARDLLVNLARLVPGVIYQYRLYPDGRSAFPYSSPGMELIYEVTPDEVRDDATPVFGRLHPDDYEAVASAIQHSARTLEEFYCEFRVLLPRQGLRWRWSQARPERTPDGGTLWHGIILDVTDRKQAELSRYESERRATAMLQAVPDLMFRTNREGVFLDYRADPKDLYVQEDLIGKRYQDLLPPDLVSLFAERIATALETGRLQTFEYELTVPLGGLRAYEARMVVSGVGEVTTVVRDMTERKRTEAERGALQAQLVQAQKIESVGRLAGGVAHDFNNMLGVILGHLDLAMREEELSPSLLEDLREIRNAAGRAADLTRQLLAFARKQTVAPRVLDVNDAVSSIAPMLQRLVGEGIKLAWAPRRGLWPVKLDSSQLDQLLTNLCANARDAIAGVGTLTIVASNTAFDAEYCALHAGFSVGEYVRLDVTDNGCGMDAATQAHIFEPFFTTKEVGKGTGLGLATVYGIVRQNAGFITVKSEPGTGTTFSVFFPRFAGESRRVHDERPAPSAGGHETILLVEDERGILNLARRVLERDGYRVLAADSPVRALSLATAHAQEVSLLITDVVMPDMTGREVADAVLALCPHLKVLYMSGYTADVIAQQGILQQGVAFIEKPFSMDALSRKVREVLDTGAEPGEAPQPGAWMRDPPPDQASG